MGTRGLCGFRVDGKDYLSYNHWDSYPSGLGKNVLEFIAATDLGALPDRVRALRLVNENDIPGAADVERLAAYTDLMVGKRSPKDWYCLLRGAQGDLEANLKAGVMIDSSEFARDSLFCEWSYVVNLDDGVLEVHKGFNKDPNAPGRYTVFEGGPSDMGYWGITLVVSYPLAEITPETVARFLRAMVAPNEEEPA